MTDQNESPYNGGFAPAPTYTEGELYMVGYEELAEIRNGRQPRCLIAAKQQIEKMMGVGRNLFEALEQIACEGDDGANEHLKKYGSYSAFDEPHAVRLARETIKEAKGE